MKFLRSCFLMRSNILGNNCITFEWIKNQKRSFNKYCNKSKNLKSYWMSHNILNAISFCASDLFSCFILEIEKLQVFYLAIAKLLKLQNFYHIFSQTNYKNIKTNTENIETTYLLFVYSTHMQWWAMLKHLVLGSEHGHWALQFCRA